MRIDEKLKGRIQKTSGQVMGVCELTLDFKQWWNGSNLYCEEIDIGVTSYPRRELGEAVSRFCHACKNNPYTNVKRVES